MTEKKIIWHQNGWICPICDKVKGIRDNGKNYRYSQCCGVKVRLNVGKRKRVVVDTVLTSCESLGVFEVEAYE
jgi:hypothetical protein